MRISDMISMCLGNLFRRKMRTLLTIVGVIVGTCAIVVMISLGLGMNLAQEAMLAQMGDLTIINVMNYGRSETGEKMVMDDEAVAKMQALPNVVVATPVYNPQYFNPSLVAGKKDRYRLNWANVIGIYAEAMPLMGYQLLEGEYPTGPQVNNRKPMNVVIGQYTDYDFEDTKSKYNNYTWPETDENGEVIRDPFVEMMTEDFYLTSEQDDRYNDNNEDDTKHITRDLKAVARIKEDWNKGYETSRGIIMDINDLKKLEEEYIKANKILVNKKENTGYNNVTVKVKSMDDVDPVETQIQAMGFETRSMETVRKPMQESARKQQMFLGMMGGISLIVAAIGITNTMIMSIYERTREIGVMKVLGCVVGNIRTVFLMEAGVIGFLGGCIGVGISYAISFAMNYFNFSTGMGDSGMGAGSYMSYGMMMGAGGEQAATAVSVIPLWLVFAAIGFATLIGLLSGILPANRAMKISALEAIKHE
ncbi:MULTISPECIES: ABC transporter permease [Anaerotruncus]|uniref:ABC transporter permease n=1 Tax=Anaerotruncus TaxID=244127 RepID=UPI0008360B34|nr:MULTISPECIES: ABC transporter permease [Anaerotruncus]